MVTVQTFTSVINQLLPEPHAGLMSGILFGTKATLSKDFYQDLVATGTIHIIALSGMNITILADLVSLALLRVVSRRVSSLLTIFIIAGFVWFVGVSASVVRAAIMGSISLLAIVFGRQYWAFLSWMLAVGSMLLLNLGWLGDLSFQLSALSTLGIILFGGNKSTPKSGNFFWHLVGDDLRLTLAAQSLTIPLILWKFQRISVISPLTNVLIGWIIQPITVMGFVTVIVGWAFLPLGQIFAWVSWVPLQYLISVVSLTARIPGASFGW